MAAVVETEGLTKVYQPLLGGAGVLALNNLSITIEQGEAFGLVGPNGSGKTTCLKLLLGLIFPTSGKARLFGKSVFSLDAKERVGFMPEAPYFYDHVTGEGLLYYYSTFFGMSRRQRKERVDELISMVGMQERRKMPLRHYSRGMLQRIGIAQAMINDPSLLILDEPTSGLDPIGSYQIRNLVREFKQKGKTIIYCSHLLGEVEVLCDRVAVLHRGNLLAFGSLSELLPESAEAVVVAGGLASGAVDEIGKHAKVSTTQDGVVSVVAQGRAALNQILDKIRSSGGEVRDVVRKKATLEEFFMNAVKRDQEA